MHLSPLKRNCVVLEGTTLFTTARIGRQLLRATGNKIVLPTRCFTSATANDKKQSWLESVFAKIVVIHTRMDTVYMNSQRIQRFADNGWSLCRRNEPILIHLRRNRKRSCVMPISCPSALNHLWCSNWVSRRGKNWSLDPSQPSMQSSQQCYHHRSGRQAQNHRHPNRNVVELLRNFRSHV